MAFATSAFSTSCVTRALAPFSSGPTSSFCYQTYSSPSCCSLNPGALWPNRVPACSGCFIFFCIICPCFQLSIVPFCDSVWTGAPHSSTQACWHFCLTSYFLGWIAHEPEGDDLGISTSVPRPLFPPGPFPLELFQAGP